MWLILFFVSSHTRASLTDAPETRRDRARYLQKGNPTATYSDVVVVTVPGKA